MKNIFLAHIRHVCFTVCKFYLKNNKYWALVNDMHSEVFNSVYWYPKFTLKCTRKKIDPWLERGRGKWMCVYVCVCVCVYIYIYEFMYDTENMIEL